MSETVDEFVGLAKDLTIQAEAERVVQARRLLEAGASPLMVDALVDAARKEMWAVLFTHLVDVAVEWRWQAPSDGSEGNESFNAGKQSGIEDCIRNIVTYAHGPAAGSA